MKVSLYPPLSIHEIGQRPNQEDSVAQYGNRLFVLCDGMGGHEKGEVASQTVCVSLVKWFEENITDDSFTDNQLREAIEYAYRQLDQYADGSPKQMGTTLTLLYVHNQGVTAAHIGDSRIYHIRPDEGILYQSRDHSLAFDLFRAGEITYTEMQNFAQKNVITRAMTPGVDNRHKADVIHITDIKTGDYFYMCSDGMLERMPNKELFGIFSSKDVDAEKIRVLVNVTADNQDNHSAWLIHVKDVVMEDGDKSLENEEPISRCNAIKLIPTDNENPDVGIVADTEDVVVVPTSTRPKKTGRYYLGLIIVAILSLIVLMMVYFAL